MKNLNIFSLVTEYENAKSEGVLDVPNVSFINESCGVIYLPKLEDHTHNGYEYVDLGLPSGLKWATCNVGATSPEQTGFYFAWGETTGYTGEQVTLGVRAFSKDVYNAGPAASISADLTLEQDAAYAYMGGKWRMPTEAEYQELLDNCDVVWTDDYNETGVKGLVFTSKSNGKLVFFPADGVCSGSSVKSVGSFGEYWSASWRSSSYARDLFFHSKGQYTSDGGRVYGYSVRGVCE